MIKSSKTVKILTSKIAKWCLSISHLKYNRCFAGKKISSFYWPLLIITKYALPLFFLVLKSNTNLQICTLVLLQEESIDMVTRVLSVAKMWNPEVAPKYAFFDFDETERPSLETVYPNIQVYLRNFHRKQVWYRWIS